MQKSVTDSEYHLFAIVIVMPLKKQLLIIYSL